MELILLPLFGIVFWFGFGVVTGFVGAEKGQGCLSFFLGFLLGPIGLIIVMFLPPAAGYVPPDTAKKCPFCAEVIKKEAVVCRYCGRDLSPATEPDGQQEEFVNGIYHPPHKEGDE